MSPPSSDAHRTVYRWDLDKTYLRTEFDTLTDLIRTAFEPATRKRTVPGAGALLRQLRDTEPAGIHILSGSPEQMRAVLERKLRLDGIRWDSFVLKPSLRNLIRGRFRFLRDQVSYKLGALLGARARMAPDHLEILFGDDAEADAFVYSLYADLGAGRVGNDTLMAVLRRARVYEEDIPELVRLAARLPRAESVRRIFIHLDRLSAPQQFEEFGHRLCPFHNYFQPALVLCGDGYLEASAALRVGAELVVSAGFGPESLGASFLDLGRRGFVGEPLVPTLLEALGPVTEELPAAGAAFAALEAELRAHRGSFGSAAPIDASPGISAPIDYLGLFSRDHARARAARRRARPR